MKTWSIGPLSDRNAVDNPAGHPAGHPAGTFSRWRRAAPALAALAGLAGGGLPAAHASILVGQSTGIAGNFTSQKFSDLPSYVNQSFDDFSLGFAAALTQLTIYGVDQGNAALNTAVVGQIWSGLPGTGSLLMSTVSGVEAGGNLRLDFGGQSLSAGHYWLSAYVERSYGGGGGQWFWDTVGSVHGSQAFGYNPGGGFGLGNTPFAIGASTDLAFQLEGNQVPEPSALGLAGLALALAFGAGLRRQLPKLVKGDNQ